MSERKSAEIKFRIAPSEKARWQELADAEEVGLSELIRRAVNERARTGGTVAGKTWPSSGGVSGVTFPNPFPIPVPRQGCPSNGKPCNCTGACMRPVGGEPKSWMFEGRNG